MREAGEDQHVLPERFERLQDPRELERRSFSGRSPVVHDDAVRDVGEGQPRRRLGGACRNAGVIASSTGVRRRRPSL